MRKLSIVAGLVLALAGCGKKDKIDSAISELEGWKSKMCACKDAACADKVHEDYKQWEDKMEKEMKDVDMEKLDRSKLEKIEKLDEERKECRRKFRDAAPAPTDETELAPSGEAPPAP